MRGTPELHLRTRASPALRIAAPIAVLAGVGHATTGRAATVTLSVPKLEGAAGTEIDVPITVKGAKGMSALQLRLTYDPAVLEVVKNIDDPDTAVTKGSILPENAVFQVFITTIPVHNGEPVPVKVGGLPIVFAGGTNKEKKEYYAVQSDGTLASIRFRIVGGKGQTSAIGLENAKAFQSNDMDMIVKTEPGEFTVVGGLPWLWIAVGGGVLVLLLLLTATRKRRGGPPPVPARAATAGAPSAPAAATAGGATFVHRCTQCGAAISLPVMFAGKEVQCSACGTSQIASP